MLAIEQLFINSNTCSCFTGLLRKFTSNDFVLRSAVSRLFVKIGRFGLKGRGAFQCPSSCFWKPDDTILKNVWSSADSPSLSSRVVFLKTESSRISLSHGEKMVGRPLPKITVLLTFTT